MRSIPLHRPFSPLGCYSVTCAPPLYWLHEPPHAPGWMKALHQTPPGTSPPPGAPPALLPIIHPALDQQVGADLSCALPIHWPCEPPHAPNSPVVASHFPSVFVTLHDRACHAASIQHLPIPILSYIAIEPDPSTHTHRIQAEKSKPFSKKEQCNS